MAKQLKITQIREASSIAWRPQKRTIKALGLGRPNYASSRTTPLRFAG